MTLFKIVVIKEKGILKLSGSKVNIAKQNIILYKISILETAFGRQEALEFQTYEEFLKLCEDTPLK